MQRMAEAAAAAIPEAAAAPGACTRSGAQWELSVGYVGYVGYVIMGGHLPTYPEPSDVQ